MKHAFSLVLCLLISLALTGCAAHRPTPEIRESGDFHFKRGEYAEAAPEYEEIVARYPGDWDAQYKLGKSLLELGQLPAARRALEIAHTRKPEDERIVDALAEVMFRQGDETELYAFLRGRAAETQAVRDYLRIVRYAMESNDPDSARTAVLTAIELDDGKSVEPYLAAADLAQRIGDMDEVVRRLRQAYGIDPTDERITKRLEALGEVPGPSFALEPGQ
jgi:tetratricopeptide (TPR) repeat protein